MTDPIDDAWEQRSAFLALCGLTADEIATALDEIPKAADPIVGITRLAERVGAIEAYLRAKIEEKRKRNVSAIIVPGRPN